MQINHGVEWAIHALVLLTGLSSGQALGVTRIAEFHGVPRDYMAKQMQALSRAGLVTSSKGRTGGYRLSKPPTEISLRSVFEAIEGTGPVFRCQEIRRNGPCATPEAFCKSPCPIAAAMLAAEKAYKEALSSTSIADLAIKVAQDNPTQRLKDVFEWMKL